MDTQETEYGFLALAGAASPGVVMLPDVWGLADHTRDLARRLVADGFTVLALDIYRKTGKGDFADPAGAMAWIRELSDPVILETIQEGIDVLASNPGVAGGRVGITGFCMGGQYTLLAACSCRGLSACAPFYGMVRYADDLDPLRKPRSPLAALADLTCPVLGFYGEEDPIIPLADVRELEERLGAGSQPAEIRTYAGAGHAFMNSTRPEMHRPEADTDAWSRLVPFLHSHLG